MPGSRESISLQRTLCPLPWSAVGVSRGHEGRIGLKPATSLTEIVMCGAQGRLSRLCQGGGSGLRRVSKGGALRGGLGVEA